MTKDVIMYDKMLTPQTYLEMMTGTYYCLNADNQLEQVENILDDQFGEGAYWSFALDNISEVMENDHKVVIGTKNKSKTNKFIHFLRGIYYKLIKNKSTL